jgi:TolB-like protein
MRALWVSLVLSTGCATILRPSSREVVVHGVEGIRVLDNGRELPLQHKGGDEYVAQVSKDSRTLMVEAPGAQTPVVLSTHLSVGWTIASVLLGFWPVVVDVAANQLTSFDDVDARTALRFAGARPQAPVEAPTARAAIALQVSGKLAVLDFQNYAKDLRAEDVRYFADVVRGTSLRRAPGLDVITRENLLVLLQASGKDAAGCEGECEVETGRRIGADRVISGEVLKIGTQYKISLKLHETTGGRLLSTGVASGKTVDELDDVLKAAASDLLASVAR